MALDAEIRFFNQDHEELLQHYDGWFALMLDDKLVGIFSTFEEAYNRGVARFGQHTFLIRLITRHEVTARISSNSRD